MQGMMQDWPLRVSRIIDHAAKYHANRPVISRSVEGPITHSNWAGVHLGARKVAQALVRLGVKRGGFGLHVHLFVRARHGPQFFGFAFNLREGFFKF